MTLPEFLVDHPDGEIRVVGHRIGLYDVIFYHRLGDDARGLHDRFPTLSLPLIERILAFYEENRAEVDAYADQYSADLERLRASIPKGPSTEELRRRLDAKRHAASR